MGSEHGVSREAQSSEQASNRQNWNGGGGWGAVGAGKGVAEEVAFELALKTEEVGREKGREWHSRERE